MGKRKYCINEKCGKSLPSSRRKYCSNYCYIEYINGQARQIAGIDKWGRKYLACSKCKKRLRKMDYRGRTIFKCFNCIRAENRKPLPSSSFMLKTFKKGKKVKKIILEITQRNRNWHYLNGRPVLGFKNSLKSFRAKCHTLVHREKFVEIKE